MRLSISSRPASVGLACSLALMTCLSSAAMAEESKLEATAHPNVMRTYAPAQSGSTTASPASGGLVVHLDEKGRPTQKPGAAVGSVTIPANNNSHEGLVSKSVKTKDGRAFEVIDLQGRFMSHAVAVIGPDGKPAVGCLSPNDVSTSGCKDKSACQEKCCK